MYMLIGFKDYQITPSQLTAIAIPVPPCRLAATTWLRGTCRYCGPTEPKMVPRFTNSAFFGSARRPRIGCQCTSLRSSDGLE